MSMKAQKKMKVAANLVKLKLDRKGNVDCQTKINIGVMIMKDGRLSIKRGYSLYDQASVSFQVCS